jgi:hypothetical protein
MELKIMFTELQHSNDGTYKGHRRLSEYIVEGTVNLHKQKTFQGLPFCIEG